MCEWCIYVRRLVGESVLSFYASQQGWSHKGACATRPHNISIVQKLNFYLFSQFFSF